MSGIILMYRDMKFHVSQKQLDIAKREGDCKLGNLSSEENALVYWVTWCPKHGYGISYEEGHKRWVGCNKCLNE